MVVGLKARRMPCCSLHFKAVFNICDHETKGYFWQRTTLFQHVTCNKTCETSGQNCICLQEVETLFCAINAYHDIIQNYALTIIFEEGDSLLLDP